MRYYISESNWSTILTFLRSQKGLHTKDTHRLRIFVEAVFYILKTGAQWDYLHKDYGNSRAVYKRYKYWADKGIWCNLMTYVSDIDSEQFMIDSLSVKVHACASGYEINGNEIHALGRSVGGFTTKIHTVTDALGNPVRFILSADKAYFSEDNIRFLTKNGNTAIIPAKENYTKNHIIDWNI